MIPEEHEEHLILLIMEKLKTFQIPEEAGRVRSYYTYISN
jgi:hypothetical protein